MFPTFENNESKRKALGRLFRFVTPKPVVLTDPGTWKNVEDHDFFEFPKDDEELLGPCVSKTLYERMVADCLEGEKFPDDADFTYEEVRERAIRTFINNIIAVTTTSYGAADFTRKDKTLQHKKVKFFNAAKDVKTEPRTREHGVFGYWGNMKVGEDVEDVESSESETPAESTNSLVEVEPPVPNIVEKYILCQCKRNEHCLTCKMTPKAFHLVVRDSYKDISQSDSTRWVLALRSLDRSFQIWVGEHVQYLINPPCGTQEWQTPADSLDTDTLTCIKDMINLSYGISHLRGRRARYVCSSIRKAVKLSDGFNTTIAKVSLAGSSEAQRRLQAKCLKYKEAIETRLRVALDLLDKLEAELLLFLHDRVRIVRDDILKNFEMTNATWPASAVRKLTFMNEVLISVYRDSRSLVPRLQEMYNVWKQPVTEDEVFAWSETVQGHIKFWGEWLEETNIGLRPLTAWAEVSDRGKESCREMHRYFTT